VLDEWLPHNHLDAGRFGAFLGLPRPPEYHVVAGAGHYDFLPPCGPHVATSPQICGDPPSFNRAAFHEQFNTGVMRFFRANLR
jgi:predicted dienelactone hydrolase